MSFWQWLAALALGKIAPSAEKSRELLLALSRHANNVVVCPIILRHPRVRRQIGDANHHEVFLVRIRGADQKKVVWACPSGRVETGQDPEHAMRTLVKEHCGERKIVEYVLAGSYTREGVTGASELALVYLVKLVSELPDTQMHSTAELVRLHVPEYDRQRTIPMALIAWHNKP